MSGLALLVSFMAPGAGQILLGKFAQGIAIGLLFAVGKSALLPLALRVCRVTQLKRTLQMLYVWNWGYILLIFGAAALAVWQAQTAREAHGLAVIFFIICVRIVKKRTLNALIFTALCGREGVWEILQKYSTPPTEKK